MCQSLTNLSPSIKLPLIIKQFYDVWNQLDILEKKQSWGRNCSLKTDSPGSH